MINISKKKIRQSANRMKGFGVGAVLLVVALVASLAALFALANRGVSTDTATQNAKMTAAGAINAANNIKTAFDKISITYGASPALISLSTLDDGVTAVGGANAGCYGVFNATVGGPQQQLPPNVGALIASVTPTTAVNCGAALNGSTDGWIMKRDATGVPTAKLNGVGTAAQDYVLILAPVKDVVCQQINQSLKGSITTPASAIALANWTTPATAVDMTGVAAIAGWADGCVTTSDGVDKNVYFKSIRDM